uniref:Uncharacterized protein n=1 Tax=Glossina austeni TaxID=7395 RepID=A0A1A9VV75_GLOAU
MAGYYEVKKKEKYICINHFVAITLLTNYTDAVDDGDDQQALQCALRVLSPLLSVSSAVEFLRVKYKEKRENKRVRENELEMTNKATFTDTYGVRVSKPFSFEAGQQFDYSSHRLRLEVIGNEKQTSHPPVNGVRDPKDD